MVTVLFVLTSASKYIDGKMPTGWYLPEAAHPYYELKDKVTVKWASPAGGKAPLDESSIAAFKDDELSQRFMTDDIAQQGVSNTLKLSELSSKDFDAVFYVGGAGPCMDLVDDAASIALIEEIYSAGKPVAAVCHGPIAFTNAKDIKTGRPLLEGKNATAISDAEEDILGLGVLIPEQPEKALKRVGANYSAAAEPWGEHVVVFKDAAGGALITGQNPASGGLLGKKLLRELSL